MLKVGASLGKMRNSACMHAQIMGFNPSKIGFLRLAIQKQLGDPEGIETCGESLIKFRRLFPKRTFFSSWSLDIQFGLLKLYQKIVKDVVPPFLEE